MNQCALRRESCVCTLELTAVEEPCRWEACADAATSRAPTLAAARVTQPWDADLRGKRPPGQGDPSGHEVRRALRMSRPGTPSFGGRVQRSGLNRNRPAISPPVLRGGSRRPIRSGGPVELRRSVRAPARHLGQFRRAWPQSTAAGSRSQQRPCRSRTAAFQCTRPSPGLGQ